MKVLVTGGSGFIGCNLVRHLIAETDSTVINIDKLTYAANPASLFDIADQPRYVFQKADIADTDALRRIFNEYSPDGVIHLAAESHVDRSIDGPGAFIETNIVGTFRLLQVATEHFRKLDLDRAKTFRFLHVSTDEVFGSLGESGKFVETTAYDPHSPYAASKAGADHLARAWHCTYGLPVIVTNCSNNYGPFQFPEKLLPLMIIRALRGQTLPVYGSGENVRDWLHVTDHVRALQTVLERGGVGQTYNIGGDSEVQNIELVRQLCDILDELRPRSSGRHQDAIEFVSDRPGHDLRYAIDASKIRGELDWRPGIDLLSGLRQTVLWYLEHRDWWEPILERRYQLERLGNPRPETAADSP